ncbi:MAG TPA: hypothetical protein VNW47_10505 [Terriglobales bacterium]|nr:hypothetical protein [Terriglobales bacterium]
MKILGAVFAGCLLLLSTAVFSNAQEEKDEGKPAAQEEAKPAVVKPEEAKPHDAKPEKPAKEDRRAQEQSKDEKQTQNNERTQQRNDQKTGENRASGNGNNGGNERAHKQNAQRIPDDKFRAHFGREHHFHVSQPVVVEGHPRVQYSGYWFEFVDQWPVGWSYSDDCYIDYIDGEYFLFDLLHPETRIAVVVIL